MNIKFLKWNLKWDWTKKNIIIASAAAAAVIAAIVLTLVFTLGGGVGKMAKRYEKSVKSATSIVRTTEMKSGDAVALEETETITFTDKDNAEIVTKKKVLSDYKMDLEETTSTASGEIDRSSLVAVNLDKSIFEKGYSYKSNTFIGKVKAENAGKLFPDASLSVSSDIDVKVELTGSRIKQITCSYTTSDGIVATVTIAYAYGK